MLLLASWACTAWQMSLPQWRREMPWCMTPPHLSRARMVSMVSASRRKSNSCCSCAASSSTADTRSKRISVACGRTGAQVRTHQPLHCRTLSHRILAAQCWRPTQLHGSVVLGAQNTQPDQVRLAGTPIRGVLWCCTPVKQHALLDSLSSPSTLLVAEDGRPPEGSARRRGC